MLLFVVISWCIQLPACCRRLLADHWSCCTAVSCENSLLLWLSTCQTDAREAKRSYGGGNAAESLTVARVQHEISQTRSGAKQARRESRNRVDFYRRQTLTGTALGNNASETILDWCHASGSPRRKLRQRYGCEQECDMSHKYAQGNMCHVRLLVSL